MEISAEKNPKLMTNSSNAIRSCITAHGQELETVKQFKYLGAIINDEGSKTEILATSAQTSKLNQFGETKTSLKLKLLHALVRLIFMYAC